MTRQYINGITFSIFLRSKMSSLAKPSFHAGNVYVDITPDEQVESTKRGQCWEYKVSDQFPVKSFPDESGQVDVDVGYPHRGYHIQTTLKNKKMNGKSTILSKNDVIVAKLTFENGVASGPCTLYDDSGILFFRGYFENGYRHGRGTEYDEEGNEIFSGYFSQGKRLKLEAVANKKGYWKEVDHKNRMVRVFKKDDNGEYSGINYIYSDGNIKRISKWKSGKEVQLIKQFNGSKMIEYKNGQKCYSGGFVNDLDADYSRNGEGEEYDKNGKTVVFKGHYRNGVRHGQGMVYSNNAVKYKRTWIAGHSKPALLATLIIIFAIVIAAYLLDIYCGLVLTAILWLLLLIRWKAPKLFGKKISKNTDLELMMEYIGDSFPVCECFANYIYVITISLLTLLLLCVGILFAIYCSYNNPYISIFKSSYVVKSNSKNNLSGFQLSNKPFLKVINIGDDCFGRVSIFQIHKLNSLRSLTIGSNSFTLEKNSHGVDDSTLFSIRNCDALESIEIGEYSFSDFGGSFELASLSALKSFKMGVLNSESYNFYEIKSLSLIGIHFVIVMSRSSEFGDHRVWRLHFWIVPFHDSFR